MLCLVSWTTEGKRPQMGAWHCHQGSCFKECVCKSFPKRTCLAQTHWTAETKVWGWRRPKSRAGFRVNGALGEARAGWHTLRTGWFSSGRTRASNRSGKWNAPLATGEHSSQKPNPRLPMGSEYGPHNPRRSRWSKRPPVIYLWFTLVHFQRASRLVRRCYRMTSFPTLPGWLNSI